MNDNVMYIIFKKCDLKTKVNIKKSCQRYNAIFGINAMPVHLVFVSTGSPYSTGYIVPQRCYMFSYKNKALEYAYQRALEYSKRNNPIKYLEYNEVGKYDGFFSHYQKYHIRLDKNILNFNNNIILTQ